MPLDELLESVFAGAQPKVAIVKAIIRATTVVATSLIPFFIISSLLCLLLFLNFFWMQALTYVKFIGINLNYLSIIKINIIFSVSK